MSVGGRVAVAHLALGDRHVTGPGHPEQAARLVAVAAGVRDAGRHVDLVRIAPRLATIDDLRRVHDAVHLVTLERVLAHGPVHLDPDTPAGPGSWANAVAAAGTGLAVVDAIDRGAADVGFVASRPPGHHAGPARAMGFCLVNNVAVAAAALRDRGERVAIVDWDVHHGNGTQEIFWDDPAVLYASIHEWPAYPGTGAAREVGGPRGAGTTVNVPLPAGSRGTAALAALDEVVTPVVDRFRPTWVLVSAGFDAHRDDPLADLEWTAGDFGLLAARVVEWVPDRRRVVAFLEGGYDLAALRTSVSSTVAALVGVVAPVEPPSTGWTGRDWVRMAAGRRDRALAEVPG